MPALPSSLIGLADAAPPTTGVPGSTPGLLQVLTALPDPRARRGIRHRLSTVVAAVTCAVVAGCRSYAAVGEWVADLPVEAAARLGMDAQRRPSESMIRRLVQALDADRLATLAGQWLVGRLPEPAGGRRALAVDGKTLRGSAAGDQPARHVLAAAEHASGAVLAQTDVGAKTNEITRFAPLLDQISDLRGVVITADALHCQREHVAYLAERGAHWILTVKGNWILTVKGNQPHLYRQLSTLPWRAVPDGDRTDDRGHGRREMRTIKVLTLASGIDFPHAAQAIRIRRRRRTLGQPKRWATETVYAITNLPTHHGRPDRLAGWIRGHWSIENKTHWVRDVTYDEDRCPARTGTGPQVMAALRNLAIAVLRLAGATNIAAANRHHARDPIRPLDLLGIT
jgi:predicted transposase YbfD/YdcC